jgi:hypothetical protein
MTAYPWDAAPPMFTTFAKRLIPPSLHPAARQARDGLALVARRLARRLRPGKFQLPPAAVAEVRRQLGRAPANLTVSRDDQMYAILVRMSGPDRAPVEYLTSGHGIFADLSAVVAAHFGGWDQVGSYLDFAAGHGRLTRWLLAERAGNRIWVSDVKPDAVRFQQRQFGVQGFVSATRPADLRAPRPFDCVTVTSLFTHLPDRMFAPWLGRLLSLVNPGGLLAFTTRPRGDKPDDFTFVPESEETILGNGVRYTLPVYDYGAAYVSERYVAGALASLGVTRHEFRPLGLCGFQDLYLVTRP